MLHVSNVRIHFCKLYTIKARGGGDGKNVARMNVVEITVCPLEFLEIVNLQIPVFFNVSEI